MKYVLATLASVENAQSNTPEDTACSLESKVTAAFDPVTLAYAGVPLAMDMAA
jgi:hypothetical protein